jgi:hypothetical protein
VRRLCPPGTQHLGWSVDVERVRPGWSRLSWASDRGSFSAESSLVRSYPAGKVRMHFALPAGAVGWLRFEPMDHTGRFTMSAPRLHCLGGGISS